jgi:hypothetical protein
MGIALTSALVMLLLRTSVTYSPAGKVFWFALAGAAIFGIGATVNRGCFFGTLSNMARGDGHMLFTLGGMMITAAFIPSHFIPTIPSGRDYSFILVCLFLLAVCLAGWRQYSPFHRLRSVPGLLIPGLTFGFIYTSNIGWSLSDLLTEIWHFVRHNESINVIRLAGFAAFLTGMVLYHTRYHKVTFKRLSATKGIKHFFAGIIMMTGSRMMGGGNDNLLFYKLPSLTPEVFLLLFVLLLSIAITLFLRKRVTIK